MPANPASQIIQSAKAMERHNAALQAGIARRDKEIAELREALVKERRRFSWAEFVLGVLFTLAAYTVAIFMTILYPHG